MDKVSLKAEKRKLTGRKVKKLREEGILPGNIYGKKFKSETIQLDKKEFGEVFNKAGETSLVEISIDKDKHLTLIKNIQKNPVSGDLIHVDFLKVSLKEKVTAMIPLELLGDAPAEKQGVGTIVQYIDEIEVEALPTDLPEKFVLSVEDLKDVDQQLKISDLDVDKDKITINHEPDQILVRVEEVSEEEIVEPTSAEGELAEGEKPEGESVEGQEEEVKKGEGPAQSGKEESPSEK
ncbi:50S ribosomal protein L25 [Candidatus Woesebacteria bacterium]|nr:50S ribosomal protein L25 [Candidatus Woesebacteria bacterium]